MLGCYRVKFGRRQNQLKFEIQNLLYSYNITVQLVFLGQISSHTKLGCRAQCDNSFSSTVNCAIPGGPSSKIQSMPKKLIFKPCRASANGKSLCLPAKKTQQKSSAPNQVNLTNYTQSYFTPVHFHDIALFFMPCCCIYDNLFLLFGKSQIDVAILFLYLTSLLMSRIVARGTNENDIDINLATSLKDKYLNTSY